MSDRDSFIDEVSEEVRKDRMLALWRRFGPWVIGAIVLVVAGAGGKTWMDFEAEKEAQRAGAAMIAAVDTAPSEAAEALTALAEQTGNQGAALLARLRAAGLLAADGRAAEAAEAYRAVATAPGADGLIRDFAAFRAAMADAPRLPPEAQAEALAPLADGAGPFRLLALEARAAALLSMGDEAGAVAALREIAAEAEAPQGLRQRAEAALAALGADGAEG